MSLARALLLCTLATALVTPAARAGWWENNHGDDLRPRSQTPAVSGSFRAYKLTSTHGRSVTVRLPRPLSLDEPLTLPAGEWATLTLVLDGPIHVDGLSLELDTLTVPLEDPSAPVVHLEWSLPDELSDRLLSGDTSTALRDRLARALEDGAIATPPAP